jgi:hypothetical protein
MIVDIEMTLDANYVCDTYGDVEEAAKDVESLLSQTYGMNTKIQEISNQYDNNLSESPSTTYEKGFEVRGNKQNKTVRCN